MSLQAVGIRNVERYPVHTAPVQPVDNTGSFPLLNITKVSLVSAGDWG